MHPDHRSIGELAYRLWQSRGCPDGTAEQDWLEAEKQLSGDTLPSPYETAAAIVKPAANSPGPATRLRDRSPRARASRSKPD
jgi:hypothetical protein